MIAHLVLHICQTDAMIDCEYDDHHMCIVVAERSQAIKIFLSCRVPQGEADYLGGIGRIRYYLDRGLEDGWYVILARRNRATLVSDNHLLAHERPR